MVSGQKPVSKHTLWPLARQNRDMTLTRVRARLATTHRVSAYGGIQLPKYLLEEIAEAVASGAVPMHFGHDISRPLKVARVMTGIENLEDGHFAAWAEFDVDEEAWSAYMEEVTAAEAPGGMSIAFTSPLEGRPSANNLQIVVAADRHHFGDVEIDAAVEILDRLGVGVAGEVLYQLSVEPIAKVVIDVVWPAVMMLGPNLVASAIYDTARSFLRPSRRGIVFNVAFKQSPTGSRKVKIHIEVSNEAELSSALARLPQVLQAGTEGTFVSRDGSPLGIIEDGTDTQPKSPAEASAEK